MDPRPTGRNELLDLEDVVKRLRPFQRHHVGVRPIPVGNVVGTEGRGGYFDREFRPRNAGAAERLRSLKRGFPEGDFPPIVVHRIGDAYFVIDGHHRVALARSQGVEMIDAEITELHSRVPLPAGANLSVVLLLQEELMFMEDSGLIRSRPDVRIRCSRPGVYLELLENVQVHGYHLMLDREHVMTPCQIAADWYDHVFLPAIRARADTAAREESPDGDFFLHLHRIRRATHVDRGCEPLEEVARRTAGQRDPVRSRLGALVGRALRRPSTGAG